MKHLCIWFERAIANYKTKLTVLISDLWACDGTVSQHWLQSYNEASQTAVYGLLEMFITLKKCTKRQRKTLRGRHIHGGSGCVLQSNKIRVKNKRQLSNINHQFLKVPQKQKILQLLWL